MCYCRCKHQLWVGDPGHDKRAVWVAAEIQECTTREWAVVGGGEVCRRWFWLWWLRGRSTSHRHQQCQRYQRYNVRGTNDTMSEVPMIQCQRYQRYNVRGTKDTMSEVPKIIERLSKSSFTCMATCSTTRIIGSFCTLFNKGPPRWRRGSGLDFGSEDPGSIPRLPSPRVGPLMARR